MTASPVPFAPRLLQVGHWKSLADAHEHALVILAMGKECSVHPFAGGYELLTAPEDADTAKHELDLYAIEQSHLRIVPPPEYASHPMGVAWWFTWITILIAMFFHQGAQPEITDRLSNSSLGLIQTHEWWRPFTALFLHADLIHLSGNILIGGLFCLLVAKSIGAWRAWILILVSGTLANAMNAAAHFPDAFESIGASTATFAALGILVGLATAEGLRGSFGRMRALAMPFLGGLILFGLLGTSGANTDVGGHGWGGLCGLLAGTLSGLVQWGQEPQSNA